MSDIKKMKKLASQEGWQENLILPQGWMIRNTRSRSKGLYITREGDLLDSLMTAKEYISKREDYTSSDVEKVGQALRDLNRQWRLSQLQSTGDSSNRLEMEYVEEKRESWREEAGLPPGWRARKTEGKTGKLAFLSPEGEQVRLGMMCIVYHNTAVCVAARVPGAHAAVRPLQPAGPRCDEDRHSGRGLPGIVVGLNVARHHSPN